MNAAAENATALRCLLIPVGREHLLVANAVVREVLAHAIPRPGEGAPHWLLGSIPWREQAVPLVSVEALLEQDYHAEGERRRAVVCAGVMEPTTLPFYALATSAVPRLLLVDAGSLTAVPTVEHPILLSRVRVAGEVALIPNLEALESMLRDHFRSIGGQA